MSRNTVAWAAKHRYPYIMLATELDPTRESFDYYRQQAQENGYEAGTQHIGYLFKVHVDETDELAEATARKYVEGPSNPFLEGNQGIIRSFIQNLPGMTQRDALLPTSHVFAAARSLPRAIALAGAWYLLSGFTVLLQAAGDQALSPWHMGIPFALGQLLVAAIVHRASEVANVR